MPELGAKCKKQPAIVYKNLNSEPSELEQSEINHNQPNIKFAYNSELATCNKSVPTIQQCLTPISKIVGVLNEIEYSSNVVFKKLNIITTPDVVSEKLRYYFHIEDRLFCDNNQISTEYFENSTETGGDVFVRLDYNSDGKIELATIKLKAIKTKFNYDYVSYSLTGSVEIEFPELKAVMETKPQPTKFSRKRQFIYWYVSLIVDNQRYVFRIAFRCKTNDKNKYECNIECEGEITGDDYILCFDLLSKYYIRQYILQNGTIQPIFPMDYNNIKLTVKQRKIIITLQILPNSSTSIKSDDIKISDEVTNFVKYLGLTTINKYLDDIDIPISRYASITHNSVETSCDLIQAELDDMF